MLSIPPDRDLQLMMELMTGGEGKGKEILLYYYELGGICNY